MNLHDIVKAVGGQVYDHGRRALIPHPGHSANDRSVSLLIDDDGRLVVHTFSDDGDWRKVKDLLRRHKVLDDATAVELIEAPGPGRGLDDRARAAIVERLWREGEAIVRTLSARHLARRRIDGPPPGPQVLRHHIDMPVSVFRRGRPGGGRPALMAAISDPAGAICALELTYLTADARRDDRLKLPRKTVGRLPAGSAVRLDPPGPTLLVAEGLFTTLSARARFDLPAWALLSVGNLRRWRPPPGVRSVLIAADRDVAGQAGAAGLAEALRRLGIAATVETPPPPFGDWNDAADWRAGDRSAAEKAGGRAVGARQGLG